MLKILIFPLINFSNLLAMDNQEEIDNENIESDLSEGEGIHVTEKQAKISINLNEPEDFFI